MEQNKPRQNFLSKKSPAEKLAGLMVHLKYISHNSPNIINAFLKDYQETFTTNKISIKVFPHSEKYNQEGSRVIFEGKYQSFEQIFQEWQKIPEETNDFLFFDLELIQKDFKTYGKNEIQKRAKHKIKGLLIEEEKEIAANTPTKKEKQIQNFCSEDRKKIRWFHTSPKRFPVGTVLVGGMPKSRNWGGKDSSLFIKGVVYLTTDAIPHSTLLQTLEKNGEKENWHVYEVEPLESVKMGYWGDGITRRCQIIRYVGTALGIINRIRVQKGKSEIQYGDLSGVRIKQIAAYKKRTKR